MTSSNSTTQLPVSIESLSRQFGNKNALNNVSLNIQAGQVFGIVGENGAGKTTLIKHLLGLYKAQQGSVKIFGLDPVESPEQVLSRIGYLSEEPDMPAWMTVSELLNYTASFYPSWDMTYANELIDMFEVSPNKKVKDLSKGQKARVGLCLAQAHRPDLLLLDEPSSGLDPNVRNDILAAIIRTVVDEGRTVIFSSHLLEEVERVSDHLLMLSHGHVLLSDSMDNVLTQHHRFVINKTFNELTTQNLPPIIRSDSNGKECVIDVFGDKQAIEAELAAQGSKVLSYKSMTLNDIFVARSKQQHPTAETMQ
ncbi:ABC transporter ATP-binding protein [Pleionea sediminis]|uniref:ABC transporter ATP-binding protein n=1 Tax=Pleionea sediminis TaxID=2569479 RepID=UPI001185CF3D|nr:ABC transporter ATP-binding protein [Pleionea sediminis]